jgi:RNA polymerase sigma-70 factor (ECF subfamily)
LDVPFHPGPTKTSEDPDLPAIRRVLSGDSSSYAEIVERHESRMRRLLTAIVADPELGEDLLQEVLFIAYRRLGDFRAESRFGTWLSRIAIREAVRARKRRGKLRRLFIPLEEVRTDGVADARGVRPEDSMGLQDMLTVFERLPVRERTALALHVVEDKSYAEIAEILGSPVGTVGSLISRGRDRLRRILNRSGWDVSPREELHSKVDPIADPLSSP